MRSFLRDCRTAVNRRVQNSPYITKDAYETFVSIVASLCFLVQGFLLTQSELLLSEGTLLHYEPKLKERAIFLDHFVTLFYTGELIGSLGCFLFADEIGRKSTLKYGALLCAASLLWYMFAGSADGILVARFVVGMFLGAMLTICPVYTAEFASAATRGQVVGMLALNTVIGSLLAVLAHYLLKDLSLGWRASLLLPVALLLVEAGLLYFLPSSPRWLLAQKTPARCVLALRQLRRTTDVSREFNEIYRGLTGDAKLGNDWSDLFMTKSVVLRLILVAVLAVAHLFVGAQLISVFGQQLFLGYGAEGAVLGMLLVLLARLLGTGVFLHYIDSLGRRPLLLFGSGLMGLAWLIAALCVYIATLPQERELLSESHNHTAAHETALSVFYITQFCFGAAVCVFAFAFATSVGSVTWVFASEVFPYRTRAKAATACMTAYFLSCVFTTTMYPANVADVATWRRDYEDFLATPRPASMRVSLGSETYLGSSGSDWDMKDTDNTVLDAAYVYVYGSGHHQHRHRGGGHSIPADGGTVVPGGTLITPDYGATQFLLKLALASLAVGMYVYAFIPETKELRLELMEELFKVDTPTTACCNCCPDIRTTGLLGLRTVTDPQKGRPLNARTALNREPSARSLQHSQSGALAMPPLHQPLPPQQGYLSQFPPQYARSLASVSEDSRLGMSHYGTDSAVEPSIAPSSDGFEDDDFDNIVPSALHKYSARMHGSQFSYFSEEEPLVRPSFDLNVV